MVFLAETPVGSFKLYFTDRGLAALEFAGNGALTRRSQSAPAAPYPSSRPPDGSSSPTSMASPPILPASPWT